MGTKSDSPPRRRKDSVVIALDGASQIADGNPL